MPAIQSETNIESDKIYGHGCVDAVAGGDVDGEDVVKVKIGCRWFQLTKHAAVLLSSLIERSLFKNQKCN